MPDNSRVLQRSKLPEQRWKYPFIRVPARSSFRACRWWTLLLEIQPQTGPRPAYFDQPSGGRQRDVRIAQIPAAEADIGSENVGKSAVLEAAVSAEHGDSTIEQRGHAHSPTRFHGQAVEHPMTRQRAHY